jgi:outer membrane receptor protein involved in Fe transport
MFTLGERASFESWMASKAAGIFRMRAFLITCWLLLATAGFVAASQCELSGVVKDQSGAAVVGAQVQSGNAMAATDSVGRFTIEGECEQEIVVRAKGFSEDRSVIPKQSGEVAITLRVSQMENRISVQAEGGTAETMTFDPQELRSSGPVSLDEKLREVPGFSLFRRTPSWAANPTTQGISLHGVGASGASRGLALLDGVPLNDPFGGWIYWGRVTPVTLESAEVAQVNASSLYGSDAVGGVVNLVRPSATTHATVETSIGDLFIPSASGVAGVNIGNWNVSGVADGFRTNGYVPVPSEFRGPVDTVTSSKHTNGGLLLERSFSHGRFFVGGNIYGESRQNGTVLQTNSATIRELKTGADWSSPSWGDWSVRGFGGTEGLRQTFTSIDVSRTTELLTRDQTVPAAQAGASLLWSKVKGRNLLVAGAESRWVDGESYEFAFTAGAPTSIVRSGGGQQREAAFAEDRIRLGQRTLVTLGGRYDHWANTDGWTSTTPLVASVVAKDTRFADRSEDVFSPRAAVSFAVTRALTLHGSAAAGFRAPTLNELYRSFRVGNVLTTANAGLKAEHSTSVEGGAALALGRAGTLRGSYFWNDLRDAVANVTQSVTPALITRQRENLGRLRSQGVDLSWEARIATRWSVMTAYEFVNPTVIEFAPDPTLVGNWIPQVARHNASVTTTYTASKYTAQGTVRFQGKQFDDDRNTLPLRSYVVVDAFLSRMLGHGVEAFVAGENLTNRRYDVGRTPVLTVGPPVLARVGVRWTLGR